MTGPGRPKKNDICISIVVVNGADTGKVSVINPSSVSTDLPHESIPQCDI